MTLVFYLSGHGFGHASRALEVMRAILASHPDTHIVVRSSVPKWFLEAADLPGPQRTSPNGADPRGRVEFQHVETDVGMVQIDSLRIDEDGTADVASKFYAGFSQRVGEEAEILRRLSASLVVGDIPPLAFSAADEAGVPSVALGNFTWDWIYAGYPQFESMAPGVIGVVGRAYAQADLALRLPFHGGFETMKAVCDVPLIARRSTRQREEVRQLAGIPSSAPVVLASFGGHGLQLPYDEIAAGGHFTLVLTDHESGGQQAPPGLVRVTASALRERGLRYADLVAASDVVVTKPGYGIVSECIGNSTSLLYTSRGRFVEYDAFVSQMPRVLRCREIPQQDLLTGRWTPHIKALLDQPLPQERLPLNGAEVAAAQVMSAGGRG